MGGATKPGNRPFAVAGIVVGWLALGLALDDGGGVDRQRLIGAATWLLLIALVLSRVPEASESPVRARVLQRVAQMLAFVDAELGEGPWFAGAEFTAADIMMVFPFTTMRHFLDYDLAPYARIGAYLKRVGERPAYRKAMQIAGPGAKT